MLVNSLINPVPAQDKMLIVGPAWVGDMVMAQSLCKLLKQRNDAPVIDVLAPEWSRPLLARMPEVRRAISMPIGHGKLGLRARYLLGKRLRSEAYTHSIVLPNSFKSALIPFWAKIPDRKGWLGEYRLGVLTDHKRLKKDAYPKMLDRFGALAFPWGVKLPALPIPKLKIDQSQLDQACKRLSLNPQGKSIIALCPGAEFGASKRWPAAYYADLAKQQIAQGKEVWLFGSPKDKLVSDQIQSKVNGKCIDLCGKTSLAEAIDLLSVANAVVSNDSGLMHIAAALDRPLVAIYGSTDPGFTPPNAANVEIIQSDLPCSPCFRRECPLKHHDCMKLLDPAQVVAMLDKVVASS